MDIGLIAAGLAPPSINNFTPTNMSTQQLDSLRHKYIKGCQSIYHEPGYMNQLGTSPYDFTCNQNHQCQLCRQYLHKINTEINQRKAKKVAEEKKKKNMTGLENMREEYFVGKPGCGCKKDKMCEKCFQKLQAFVTKCEKGCGKQWEQQFGGMAAGPATVQCKDNFFLCLCCSAPLQYIKILEKQFPHVKLEHIQQQQKLFWKPKYGCY